MLVLFCKKIGVIIKGYKKVSSFINKGRILGKSLVIFYFFVIMCMVLKYFIN